MAEARHQGLWSADQRALLIASAELADPAVTGIAESLLSVLERRGSAALRGASDAELLRRRGREADARHHQRGLTEITGYLRAAGRGHVADFVDSYVAGLIETLNLAPAPDPASTSPALVAPPSPSPAARPADAELPQEAAAYTPSSTAGGHPATRAATAFSRPTAAPRPSIRPSGPAPGPPANGVIEPSNTAPASTVDGADEAAHGPAGGPESPAARSAPTGPGTPGSAAAVASRFRPTTQEQLAPSGSASRVAANLRALQTLRGVQAGGRVATAEEQAVLAQWSGWGAVPDALDERKPRFAQARDRLAQLLSPVELTAAARNTLNAHYTDLGLVTAVWDAVTELGFRGGRVLEPGCGSGNFIGAAPAGCDITGIEVEPVTAGIAAALYPDAHILTESFADTRAPEGGFDLAIGNVPFGKFALVDRRHNGGRHSIHNHFIIKALHLVAPGGTVAVITSRYTLDAQNPAARREIAELADLLGAIRLPAGAHQRAAGTAVVTDLLLLRRREPDRAPLPVDWERTREIDLDGHTVRVNPYFLTRPDRVCGQLGAGSGPYGGAELTVVGDRGRAGPGAGAVRSILSGVVAEARAAGLVHSPASVAVGRAAARLGSAGEHAEGYLAVDEFGAGFTRVDDGVAVPVAVPKTQAVELRALLGLRDTALALLSAEAAALDPTPEMDQLRAELNRRYDAYLARYGPLNRLSWRRTGRVDAGTGEELLARQRPGQGGFRADPHAPVVYALEHFDPTLQRAAKADIFSIRVTAPRAPRRGADTPADALAICFDLHGRIDLDEIASLLGIEPAQARTALGTLVFDDPAQHGLLVTASEYLSGNVRERLQLAEAAIAAAPAAGSGSAAGSDVSTDAGTRYAPNVAALTRVIPRDLQPSDISARLGASWIDASDVQVFLRELLDDYRVRVEHPYGSTWSVAGDEGSVAATSTWGTPEIPAPRLAQRLLTQSEITVHDEIAVSLPDGGTSTRRVLNLNATVAAQAKAEQLATRFAEWVWEDPRRAERLARVYNDRFNAIVLRSYDDVALSLPGLALSFRPRPHQVAAVARMICEPAVGLYHEVGAGKTAEMAMGVMELRRLGLIGKAAVVVPNNMLEQFGREWLQLYPQAKLLVATRDDLTRDRRRAFVARVATGDWDAVIMTRTAFERIPMSPGAQAAYIEDQSAQLREAIERSGEDSRLFKQMQATLTRFEERIEQRLAIDHDPAVTFERTGFDYVVVDEAHGYKNLRTPSNIPGAGIDGSNRSSDLEMKLHYLRHRHGSRVATFATATPIANSITEAHVMQRYLRPDLLAAAGVADFDVWAATFGQTTTGIELSPDGTKFRLKSRFARFHNVPELLHMWHVSGDIKTAEDLRLPTPELAARPGDGARVAEVMVIEPSAQLVDYIADLGRRADDVAARKVEPDRDNMLKISGDGRRAALDMRLVGEPAPPGTAKLDLAADRIAGIWRDHHDDVFAGPDGEPDPVRGALQIVFCDLSTPSPQRWNAYDELRALLVTRGMAAESIRFAHDARNDQEKGELFAQARSGRVAVLIGSTEKMGVGTNVQARAVALHHLDCPWRPADLQQRDGRILRQGNQNTEVQIIRYVVEGSFDAYSWQTVARKAQFIAQVMRGRLDVREIDDIGDSTLSFNEVKALATGNPLVLDQAAAVAELTRLERLDRSHTATRQRLRDTITHHEHTITRLTGQIPVIDTAIQQRRPTRGDLFAATVNGIFYDTRTAAGTALTTRLAAVGAAVGGLHRRLVGLVELGGLVFDATIDRTDFKLQLPDVPDVHIQGSHTRLVAAQPSGIMIRLENALSDLDRVRTRIDSTIPTLSKQILEARSQLEQPFPHTAALTAARDRLADIEQQIAALATEPTTETTTSTAPPPEGTEPGGAETSGPGGAETSGRSDPDTPESRPITAGSPAPDQKVPHRPLAGQHPRGGPPAARRPAPAPVVGSMSGYPVIGAAASHQPSPRSSGRSPGR